MQEKRKQKIKEIYDVLPHLNCGFCGYKNCGHYARMVAEGKAPSNLCLGGPYVAWRIKRVTGIDKLEEIERREQALFQKLGELRKILARRRE
jgi:Na+-translocating ferredoxin:NAD+ oxidoreductase RNF subunit RnfB